MKRVLLALIVLISTSSPVHAATLTACESVKRDSAVVKGSYLQCLANTDLAFFESFRGPMVVNFWGSWCGPCADEMPYFRKFFKDHKEYALVGVDVEEAKIDNGRTFATYQKMVWPNFFDYSGSTRGVTGIGVPVTIFINKSGKIVHKKVGVLKSYKELESLAKKYLR